eukprot:Colp12_sorted_trinity150504_noHs@31809
MATNFLGAVPGMLFSKVQELIPSFETPSPRFLLGSAIGTYTLYKLFRFVFADSDSQLWSTKVPKDFFRDKVVWITGASSGIGEHLAYAFSEAGAKVILTARREEELNRVRCALPGGSGDDVSAILTLDLSDHSQLASAAVEAELHFGHVDILINNAGISSRASVLEASAEVEKKVVDLDYLAPVLLSKAVLPRMLKRNTGCIVNISSLNGKFASVYRASYSGAKHALLAYMDALRLELLDTGVRVVNVCPGPVVSNVTFNSLLADGTPNNRMSAMVAKGMPPQRHAELVLRAVYCGVSETWISRHPYLLLAYANQWLPPLFRLLMFWDARKAKRVYRETGVIP